MKNVVQRVLRERYAALANKSERATAKLAREESEILGRSWDFILVDDIPVEPEPVLFDPNRKIIFGMDMARGLEETVIWWISPGGLVGITSDGRYVGTLKDESTSS